MRATINTLCIGIIILLQYQIWFGSNNIWDYFSLYSEISKLESFNQEQKEKNLVLQEQLEKLNNDQHYHEYLARRQYNLRLKNEVFIPLEKEAFIKQTID